jgi:hypothetical protein
MKFIIEVADRYEDTMASIADYISRNGDVFIHESFGEAVPILIMEAVQE